MSDEQTEEPVPESGAWIRPFVDGAAADGAAADGVSGDGAAADGVSGDGAAGDGEGRKAGGRGGDTGAALRPFLLTDGRVATDDAIAIETQVVTTDLGRAECVRLGFERRDIVALCDLPQSVAEIAASLSLHLGVVRVLVGDLSADGHLSVHLPDADVAGDVDTLLRVIRGLRSIR